MSDYPYEDKGDATDDFASGFNTGGDWFKKFLRWFGDLGSGPQRPSPMYREADRPDLGQYAAEFRERSIDSRSDIPGSVLRNTPDAPIEYQSRPIDPNATLGEADFAKPTRTESGGYLPPEGPIRTRTSRQDYIEAEAALQAMLEAAGYSVGPDGVDGKAGDNTFKALNDFLEAEGFSGRYSPGDTIPESVIEMLK